MQLKRFTCTLLPRYQRYGYATTSSFPLKLTESDKPREMFQLLTEKSEDKGVATTKDLALKLYCTMIRLTVMDKVFYDAQRQGRVSFYMTSMGEEACVVGSASGLELQDEVFCQYREQGVLLWRGFQLDDFANQLFGNSHDLGKGRQMPVHYGSRALHYQTISSPLSTQIPQAAGAAYALKGSTDRIACCYFGDGAASEGDFHAGMMFASSLHCPVLYICRNNGFAISTPTREQYAGDGIVSRALGYGMASIRVDGNDVFAMHEATRRAREYVLKEQRPVLLEAMTYRVGHHSTSDDSTRYRPIEEIESWRVGNNPIERLKRFLLNQSWWSEKVGSFLF